MANFAIGGANGVTLEVRHASQHTHPSMWWKKPHCGRFSAGVLCASALRTQNKANTCAT